MNMIIHKNYQLYSGKCEKSYPLLDPQRTLYYILWWLLQKYTGETKTSFNKHQEEHVSSKFSSRKKCFSKTCIGVTLKIIALENDAP